MERTVEINWKRQTEIKGENTETVKAKVGLFNEGL